MSRRRTMKARLSTLASALYLAILEMKPRQRGAARRALNKLGGGDPWTLNAMRPVLHEMLDMASTGRSRKRAKKEDS